MFLSKQQGRFGRYAMLAGVIACASFAATAAQAGGCPADQTKPDLRPPVDLKPVGVTDTVIAMIDVDKEQGIKDRTMRMRKLVVEPGGVVPWHSHGDRPAIITTISGTITEYRSTCAVGIEHPAGDVAAESGGISHWWKNNGKVPAVLLSADIKNDGAPADGDQM